MRLELQLAGRVAWRALIALVALEGLLLALSLADLARRDPLVAAAGGLRLAPILLLYGAAPCLAAALAGAVAACFAGWREDGELLAASATGAAPRRFLAPVLVLALLGTAWTGYHEAQRFPAARAAKHAELRRLARDPEVLLGGLATRDGEVGDVRLAFEPGRGGRFEQLVAAELGADGAPRALWRAPAGALLVPAARDVLALELEQPVLVRKDEQGRLERIAASHGRIERPLAVARTTTSERVALRQARLGELLEARSAPRAERRSAAREELARRLGSALMPLAACFAASAIGLGLGRRGAALAMTSGIALVGLVLLPGVALGARLVGEGHALALVLVPHALVAIAAAPAIGRWRIH